VKADFGSVLAAPMISLGRTGDYLELVKPRITLLVVITTLVGFYTGAEGEVSLMLVLHTLIGTALVAGGASAFNMYLEREYDALMQRTFRRPLPTGRLQGGEALGFAFVISLAGILYLVFLVNRIAGLLAVTTLLSYLFVYTPLKRRTWLCTLVGAVPGALPAPLGWAAATGGLSFGAWVLFAIIFFWQLPHFYAIGWMYREDYARAGFPMLAVIDRTGSKTSSQSGLFIGVLIVATLVPWLMGIAGTAYLIGALALGIPFVLYGIIFARQRNHISARRLFAYSLYYLPGLFTLLMIDKVAR